MSDSCVAISEIVNMEDSYDRLMAAVLRRASIDYIKAKRKFNKGNLTKEELKSEIKEYVRCIDNWTPYTYDIINPEFMITECNRIALTSKNVEKMGLFNISNTKGENNK